MNDCWLLLCRWVQWKCLLHWQPQQCTAVFPLAAKYTQTYNFDNSVGLLLCFHWQLRSTSSTAKYSTKKTEKLYQQHWITLLKFISFTKCDNKSKVQFHYNVYITEWVSEQDLTSHLTHNMSFLWLQLTALVMTTNSTIGKYSIAVCAHTARVRIRVRVSGAVSHTAIAVYSYTPSRVCTRPSVCIASVYSNSCTPIWSFQSACAT